MRFSISTRLFSFIKCVPQNIDSYNKEHFYFVRSESIGTSFSLRLHHNWWVCKVIQNGLKGTGSASVFQAKVKMHCFLMYFPIEWGFVPRYFCHKPVFMSSWKVHVDQSKHFKNMPNINQTISHNSNCYMKKEYKQKKNQRSWLLLSFVFQHHQWKYSVSQGFSGASLTGGFRPGGDKVSVKELKRNVTRCKENKEWWRRKARNDYVPHYQADKLKLQQQ